MTPDKSRRLGRGLEALISTAETRATTRQTASELQRIPLARVKPNPFQPRRTFKSDELSDLESSIRASGLLHPIAVRPAGEAYELIAGERRLRAVSNLGWTDIPAIVRDLDDQTLLILALVENLQRTDLNAIEEAEGYQRLTSQFKLTHTQIAQAVGKDRSTIANLLRILALPEVVRQMVQEGHLSAGHARALLTLGDQRAIVDLANEILAAGLSVRETERRAKAVASPASLSERTYRKAPKSSAEGKERFTASADVKNVENALRRYLQTDVQITLSAPEKGTLAIAFYSADDLERLLDAIIGKKRNEL